jgi:hypothetical protein
MVMLVSRATCVIALALLLAANAAEVKRSLRSLDTWGGEDMIGEGMSGALVGGMPDDDALEDEEEEDEVDKALKGTTAFHRTVAGKHLRHSSDEEDDEDDADDEKEIALARSKKMHAEAELKSFEDDAFFDKTLAMDVSKISNETQSPALAKFLGDMKENQRKYARPEYIEFLNKQIKDADAALKKAGLETGEAKKDDAEDDEKEDEEKKVAKKAPVTKEATKEEKTAKDAIPVPSVHQSAGETFAIAFFANVAMLACVFAMASAENKTVANYTWFLIDQVVAIFLAVMHFQAFDSLLSFSSMGVGNKVAASIVHMVALLFLVVFVAAYLQRKGDKNAVAVLCGAGAHFVSFSAIHAGAGMQNKVFVAASYTVEMCILGLVVLCLGIGIIGMLVYKAKQRFTEKNKEGETINMTEDDDFMDKSDDVENDAGATAFSVVFTMLIRFLLTGHHPKDDDTDFDHTAGQRTAMLIYAFICLIVAGVGINFIAKKCPDEPKNGKEYAVKRVCNFFKTVLAMNVAWAFLYWGEWEFFEALYPHDPIKGRVMFAIVTTLIGGLLLIALSKTPDRGDKALIRTKLCALTALSLVIAFSWELCFDSAVEQMVEGQAHPVFLKVLSCVVMLAIILPVYVIYMKPIVDAHPTGA